MTQPGSLGSNEEQRITDNEPCRNAARHPLHGKIRTCRSWGDCICPDDAEGVTRSFCVALAGHGAVGAADLLALLVNWGPWQRQGKVGWVGFEPTSNRL